MLESLSISPPLTDERFFDFLLFEGFEFVDLAFFRDYFPLFLFLLLLFEATLLGFIDYCFDNLGLIAIAMVFDFFKGTAFGSSSEDRRGLADVFRPPIDLDLVSKYLGS